MTPRREDLSPEKGSCAGDRKKDGKKKGGPRKVQDVRMYSEDEICPKKDYKPFHLPSFCEISVYPFLIT